MDPVETFLSGCSQPFVRVFLFVSAVWSGCIAAGIPIGAGLVLLDPTKTLSDIYLYILFAPILLISRYAILNFAIFPGTLGLFITTDRELFWWWCGAAFSQSLFAMLGYAKEVPGGPWIQAAVWLVWLINISVVCAGAFYVRQWQRNRWAGQMAQLKAENAQRRAELAKRGIATFDPDPQDLDY